MKFISKTILILLFIVLLPLRELVAQTDTVIVEVDLSEYFEKKYDSLKIVYDKLPKEIIVSTEVNGKEVQLNSSELYLEVDGEKQKLEIDDSNRIFINFEVNTSQKAQLFYESKEINIDFVIDSLSMIRYGLFQDLGVINNLKQVIQKDTFKRINKNSENLTWGESIYKSIILDHDLKEEILKNKYSKLTYCRITPIVFGHGIQPFVTTIKKYE